MKDTCDTIHKYRGWQSTGQLLALFFFVTMFIVQHEEDYSLIVDVTIVKL